MVVQGLHMSNPHELFHSCASASSSLDYSLRFTAVNAKRTSSIFGPDTRKEGSEAQSRQKPRQQFGRYRTQGAVTTMNGTAGTNSKLVRLLGAGTLK
jgi:hypothetical protein